MWFCVRMPFITKIHKAENSQREYIVKYIAIYVLLNEKFFVQNNSHFKHFAAIINTVALLCEFSNSKVNQHYL